MASPIRFPDCNFTWTAPDGLDNCSELPVLNDGTHSLSCWRLSWRERLAALVYGKAWLCVIGHQPPVWIRVERDVLEERLVLEEPSDG